MIRFGSVCSGIEAASVAWHPLGWEAAWFSEIEPFPCNVLARHYPNVPNLGDMTTIAERILSGELVAPEVFTGGTPCQAFSVSGLRRSLDDARGNLALAFCDLADAIDARADRPSVILWENVVGVLSTKDNAFGCLLGRLAGEDCALQPPGRRWPHAGVVRGLRRDIAWRVLDAKHFGVAQSRPRVWLVASARMGFDPAEVLFERVGVDGDRQAPSAEAAHPCLQTTFNDYSRADGFLVIEDPAGWRRITMTEAEKLMGFPSGYTNIPGASDRARAAALGNSWAVPCAAWIGERIYGELLLA